MIKGPFIRTPYNYNSNAVSDETGLDTGQESLTQQQFKDEVNLNNIVQRFGVGVPVMGSAVMPTYGDFTGVSDYRTALDAIMAADDAFMSLPPTVRERFQNDPAALVDFCSDPVNRSEAMELGLVPPPSKPDGFVPTPGEVVTEAEKS